jgi:hypothetical protein
MLPEDDADVNDVNYDKLIFDLTFSASEALKDMVETGKYDNAIFTFYKNILADGLLYFERIHNYDGF